MIDRVVFKNFKAFRSLDVSLSRLTVFVGANGTGKSTVLDGLDQVGKVSKLKSGYPGRPPQLSSLYSERGEGNLVVSIEWPEAGARVVYEPKRFETRLGPGRAKWEAPTMFDSHIEIKSNETWDAVPPDPNLSARLVRVLEFFPSVLRFQMDPRAMARPSYSDRPNPSLEGDGGTLATVLSYMALNRPDEFDEYQARLRRVLPSIKRLRIARAPVSREESSTFEINGQEVVQSRTQTYMGERLVFDFVGATSVPADLVSEGTLFVAGLMAALMGPPRSRTLLLDDIDRGLHPKAQRQLVELLHQLLNEDPELQVVATTHSSYLLDHLGVQEVRCTALDEDGAAVCAPLLDHPNAQKWREEMDPGELWSLFGDQWIAEASKAEALGA